MSVPTHIRVAVRGSFAGTPEAWSNTFHFSRENGAAPDADYAEIDVDGMLADCAAFYGSSDFCSTVVVDDVRAYVIGTNGRMQGNGPKMAIAAPGAVHGSGGAFTHPPQITLVMTTVAVNRGPAKFGRVFLPMPNIGTGADGRLSTGSATNIGTAFGAFYKALSDRIDLDLANSSKGLNVSEGPAGSPTGTAQEIDHIEVGRVWDTLRNRRKSLLEDRQVLGHLDW